MTKRIKALTISLIICVVFLLGCAPKSAPTELPCIPETIAPQETQPTEDSIATMPTETPTEAPTEASTEPTEPPIPTVEDIRTEEFEEFWHESAVYMAKTIWGEARGTSEDGQRKVGWCILNRVDDPRFDNTIIKVITAPSQFHGYSSSFPCTDEFYEMSMDIIANWQLEKIGGESNRNLDEDYLFFCADESGLGNIFRKEWQ